MGFIWFCDKLFLAGEFAMNKLDSALIGEYYKFHDDEKIKLN